MQIICKDGTTIQCRDFEATDSGVLFYQDVPGKGDESGDEEDGNSADGFVPVTELRFVLPDEMVQRAMSAQSGTRQQGMGGSPERQPQGQFAQQQQMGVQRGGPQQGPPGQGGQ